MKIQNVANAEKKKNSTGKNYCDKSKHLKLLVISSLAIKDKEQSKPPNICFYKTGITECPKPLK